MTSQPSPRARAVAALFAGVALVCTGPAAAQTAPDAAPEPARSGGPVVLLAEPPIRPEVAQALAVELAPLRLAVVQSDPPVGDTPLARAASAQATAVAAGAQAAVWLEPAPSGLLVRTVLADGIQTDEVALATPSPRAIAVVAAGQLEGRLTPGAEPPAQAPSTTAARLRIEVPQVSGSPLVVEAELSTPSAAEARESTPADPPPAPPPEPAPESDPPVRGPHVFGWIGGTGIVAYGAQLAFGAGGQAGIGIDPIPELRIALGGMVGWTSGTAAAIGSENVISTLGAAEIGPRFALGDVHLITSARFGVWASEDTGGASVGPTGGLAITLEIPVLDVLAVVLRAQTDLVFMALRPQPGDTFVVVSSLMIGLEIG